jgi:hypothetical protein
VGDDEAQAFIDDINRIQKGRINEMSNAIEVEGKAGQKKLLPNGGRLTQKIMEAYFEETTYEMYSSIDLDGDGVDLEQIKKIMKDLNEDVGDEECERVFESADKNHNGSLSFEEFYKAMHQFGNTLQRDRATLPKSVLNKIFRVHIDPVLAVENEFGWQQDDGTAIKHWPVFYKIPESVMVVCGQQEEKYCGEYARDVMTLQRSDLKLFSLVKNLQVWPY